MYTTAYLPNGEVGKKEVEFLLSMKTLVEMAYNAKINEANHKADDIHALLADFVSDGMYLVCTHHIFN